MRSKKHKPAAPALTEAMLEPGFYPHRPERVELRETHSSWVFLAGDVAYKVKKPVRFPFLDYSTLERRREMCEAEVRLNRRLAPRYYIGVESVVAGPSGPALGGADHPAAVEYVVKMRRVPEERTLEHLVRRGALADAEIDAVARRLAAFHAFAPAVEVDAAALEGPVEENVETLREVGPPTIPADRLRAMAQYTDAFLAARSSQIRARQEAGRIRDCHGDLRAEHVIVAEDIAIYDCVEFNRDLRAIDVSADLAFLLMDLWRLEAGEAAERLVSSYREAGGDPGDDALLHFYAAYRAWVRAKVDCLRLAELADGDPQRSGLGEEIVRTTALGHRLAWSSRRPLVLVVCGPARSGKTTLATRLATISGLPHLRSDLVRKELAGVAPLDRGPEEIYTEELSRHTYAELGRAARAALKRNRGAIVDATFRRRADRASFAAGLGTSAAPVLFAGCSAPLEVLLERAARPPAAPPDVSDATPEIVRRQLEEFEPLEEVPEGRRLPIVTDRPLAEQVIDAERLADRSLELSGAPSAR